MLAGNVNGSCSVWLAPAAKFASDIAPGETRMSDESNVELVERYIWDSAVLGAALDPKFSTEKAMLPPPPATRLELTSEAVEIFRSDGPGADGDVVAPTVIVVLAKLLEFPALSNARTAISSVPA